MRKVCVLGLGYIGLPTASILAVHGFEVLGVDVNPTVVMKLQEGEPHIKEPGLRTLVEAAVKSGRLVPTTTVAEADVFIIAVPTPVTPDKRADLSYVEAAATSIVPVLRKGNLVVLESTCPPGTTAGLLAGILSRAGLEVGSDVFVAYCPERVLPGQILREIVENDRIIGGLTPESAQAARDLYASFVSGEIFLTDATTAEMVKLIENIYRDVNIALANEVARICEVLGIDAWEVIELANRHPRVNLHKPGPGVGGHCLPVDPWFIVERVPALAKLIRLSREINDGQPEHVAALVEEMVRGIPSPKVAILGAAYKADVDDARESPTLDLVRILQSRGYTVSIHDPYVERFDYELVPLEQALQGADCIVLMVDHSEYRKLKPEELGRLMRTRQVVDTRRVLDMGAWQRAGFRTRLLGKGDVQ